MDPLSIAVIAFFAMAFIGNRKPNPRAFWRGAWRIARWVIIPLVTISLAFLVWYTVAAIPVSVAIILGAVIIVWGMHRVLGLAMHSEHPVYVDPPAAPAPAPCSGSAQDEQFPAVLHPAGPHCVVADYWREPPMSLREWMWDRVPPMLIIIGLCAAVLAVGYLT